MLGGGLFLLTHFIPYYSPFILPSLDLLNIGATLNYLSNPDNFQGNGIVSTVYGPLRWTAPVYYYTAYGLTAFVSSIQVPKIMGLISGALAFLLAGGRWKGTEDYLRAITILVIFSHAGGSINPLLGEKRSFTLPIVLFLVHPWFNQRLIIRLLFLAISTGLYPPAAVIFLSYVILSYLLDSDAPIRRWNPIRQIGYLSLHFVVVLAVMMPYLMNALMGMFESVSVDVIRQAEFSLLSPGLNLIYGSHGALFTKDSTALMFFVFLGFCALMYVSFWLDNREFTIPKPCLYLVGTSLSLWLLSHLFHPLLYQPSRYSRVALIVAILMTWTRNLQGMGHVLRRFNHQYPLFRMVTQGVLLASLVLYLRYLWLNPSVFHRGYMLDYDVYGGIVVGILWMLATIEVVSRLRDIWLVTAVSLGLLVFSFPHYFGNYHKYESTRTIIKPYYEELFEAVGTLPRDAVIAGESTLMNWIPAFGQREVYFNHKRNTVKFVCDRDRAFEDVYYARSPETILDYLENTPVSHIVLIREHLDYERYFYRCDKHQLYGSDDFVLDRHFPSATWHHGRDVYLLSRETLRNIFEEER